ncbi:MAG: xylose isomerase [Candidatus Nanopelagicales bacterium]|nr:xylose isomerase [Candidatus Nanopelagicales bacterium]MCF8539643.1 xylose isomerase [Candidatus Nanopelagicales bacterium]
MNDRLTPTPEDKFAFGLWTIGHPGRDPFGDSTRPPVSTADFVRGLADIGAWGVSFHDDDLMTFGAPESERRAELDAFKKVLDETGVVCSMATTNLFWHPVFKDGAFTSNDRNVRRFAIQKTLRNIDVAAELGAPTYVLWGGREGVESAASKNPGDALFRYKEALDFLCGYVRDKGYNIRFAMEPKPNEPRGDTFLPTIGHTMAFINELEYPDMVGLNPEVAHETMAGLSFFQGVAQALWQGKLYHIDLNDQKIGRFDQDLRFGSEGIKDDFMLVRLLENSDYNGPKHFDARPYRNEWGDGIWDFARGCMRTYLALAAKAREFDQDPRVKEALSAASVPELAEPTIGSYSTATADRLLQEQFDAAALAARGYANEALDQLVIDQILGIK